MEDGQTRSRLGCVLGVLLALLAVPVLYLLFVIVVWNSLDV